MKKIVQNILFLNLILITHHVQPQGKFGPQLSFHELTPSCLGYFLEEECKDNFNYQYRSIALQTPELKKYRQQVSQCANCTACAIAAATCMIVPQPYSGFVTVASIPVTRYTVLQCCNEMNQIRNDL